MVVCLPAPEGFEIEIVSSSFPAALRIHRADVRYRSSPWEFSSSGLVSTAWSLSAEPGRPVRLNSASENRAAMRAHFPHHVELSLPPYPWNTVLYPKGIP